MENVLAYVKTVVTSTWVGLFFNLAAIGSLWLSIVSYRNAEKVEDKAAELNRKAQLLYRGPGLLKRIQTGRRDLNEMIQAESPDLLQIASQNGILVELVKQLDAKLHPSGTEHGRAIIQAAENRNAKHDVLRLGRQLYIRLAGFAVRAEEQIEDQKQSLL